MTDVVKEALVARDEDRHQRQQQRRAEGQVRLGVPAFLELGRPLFVPFWRWRVSCFIRDDNSGYATRYFLRRTAADRYFEDLVRRYHLTETEP